MIKKLIAAYISILSAFLLPLNLSQTHIDGQIKPVLYETKDSINYELEALSTASKVPNIIKSRTTLLEQAGVPKSDWEAIDYIFSQESGWCHLKWQFSYTCPTDYVENFSPHNANVGYGLCQSTPAIKYETMSKDWKTNALTQVKWCYKYFLEYGSVQEAATFKKCVGTCYSPKTKKNEYKKTPWI